MREELFKEIESRKPISHEVLEGTGVGSVQYYQDPFTRLNPWNEEHMAALLLRDVAKSLRILIELQLEHLSEHGS